MSKRMLIDATHTEETRVAVVDGNRLIEFDYESKVRKQLKGSIFLAKVTRVEPSLQAAFVNFGGNRHAFLPFAEIHPDYFRIPVADREALIAEQKAMLERLAAEEDALIAEEEAALAALEAAKLQQEQGQMDSPFAADEQSVQESEPSDEFNESNVESIEQDRHEPIILNDNDDDDSDEDDSDDEDEDESDGDDSEDTSESNSSDDSEDNQSFDSNEQQQSDNLADDSDSETEQNTNGEQPHIHAWVYRAVTMYDEQTGKFEATDEGTIQHFSFEIASKLKALCEAYADIVRIRVDSTTPQSEPEPANESVEDIQAELVAETNDETSTETAEQNNETYIVYLAYKADNAAMMAQEQEEYSRGGRGRYGRRFRGRGKFGNDRNRGRNDNQQSNNDDSAVTEASEQADGNQQNSQQNRGRGRHNTDRGNDRGRGRGRNGQGGGRQSFRSRKVEMIGGDTADGDQPFRFNLRRNYKIQEVIKRGQIMLIQVQKEERGNKGAAVTSYLSLPGRFSVLMPNSPRGGGVSRKIASFAERKRMREILKELSVPDGMSVILRTAGVAREKDEIKRDLDYLMRLWDNIRALTLESSAPSLVYEESSLVKRAVRDIYSSDIEEILVAGQAAHTESKNFMNMLMPDHANRVTHYTDEKIPLFHRYQVENQIAEIGEPVVQLRSGGYLVLSPTEALVSVDVNSGRATKERHIEETALKTNLEAADEVARQLRLRDLGGLVVIDFIDMEDYRNNAKVERRLREALSTDRARIQVGRISSFGLLELSRQRLNPSLTEAQFEKCSHCHGAGYVRTVDSASILALRALEEEGIRGRATQIFLSMPNTVALYILNNKRDRLIEIEKRYGFEVFVRADDSLAPTGFHLEPIKGEVTRSEDDDDHSGDDYPSSHSDHDSDETYSEQPQIQQPSRSRQTRQNNDRPRSGHTQNQGRDSGRGGRGQNRNHDQQQSNEMANEMVQQPSAPTQEAVETTSPAKAPPKDTGFKAKRFSSRKPKSETPKNETPNTELTDVTNIISAPQVPISQPAKANDDHEYGSSSEASQSGSKKKGWWNKLID